MRLWTARKFTVANRIMDVLIDASLRTMRQREYTTVVAILSGVGDEAAGDIKEVFCCRVGSTDSHRSVSLAMSNVSNLLTSKSNRQRFT